MLPGKCLLLLRALEEELGALGEEEGQVPVESRLKFMKESALAPAWFLDRRENLSPGKWQ